jgi:DNA-binding GntR family transcriptional regulator
MEHFLQIKSTSMRESVGEAIRQALSSGRFEPGEALSEAGLAAEIGISRGPVREALLLLAQEGLLTHSQNRGFSVVQITSDDLKEIQEVRTPLESTALALAKPHIASDDIEHLKGFKSALVSAFIEGNVLLCSQSDMQFHSLIWDRTGNSRLSGTLRSLLAPFFAYGSVFRGLRRPDLTAELIAEEHELIIDFLSGKNNSSAQECVRFHLGL